MCPFGQVPFLGSSTAEHPAVNRRVAGSNPARGAITNIQVSGVIPLICFRIHTIHTPALPFPVFILVTLTLPEF